MKLCVLMYRLMQRPSIMRHDPILQLLLGPVAPPRVVPTFPSIVF